MAIADGHGTRRRACRRAGRSRPWMAARSRAVRSPRASALAQMCAHFSLLSSGSSGRGLSEQCHGWASFTPTCCPRGSVRQGTIGTSRRHGGSDGWCGGWSCRARWWYAHLARHDRSNPWCRRVVVSCQVVVCAPRASRSLEPLVSAGGRVAPGGAIGTSRVTTLPRCTYKRMRTRLN